MKASYTWLCSLVPGLDKIPARDLAQKLTFAGLEVEGMTDEIFEINVTPNRGDALSHWGLAREIVALTGLAMNVAVTWPAVKKMQKAAYQFFHSEKTRCSRFTTSQIFGVRVAKSPAWLAEIVESLGVRSINNIVDATNYVMLLTGHPVHAYDAERLAGPALSIQSLREAQKFVTLDGLERSLAAGDLVISDAERIVGLAGIMGGQNSEILASTQNVILEVAHFDAASIRKTARRLGIKTESSYRFERFVNPETVLPAHTILQSLMIHVAGGQTTEILDSYPKPGTPDEILLKADYLERTLGYAVPETRVESILVGLGCRVKKQKNTWQVTVPLARSDLKRSIDLVEEVARIEGFDKIPTVLPHRALHSPHENESSRFSFVIKDYLVSQGFLETVHYSFADAATLKKILNTHDDSSWIYLSNPIAEDLAVMRPSLLPGLLSAYQKNQGQSEAGLRLFELRRVYSRNTQGQITETKRLGLLLSGNVLGRNPFALSRMADFFDAKGLTQNILRLARLSSASRPVTEWPYHPTQAMGFFCGDKVLACVGTLHPQLLQSLKIKERLCYADFDFEVLSTLAVQKRPHYQTISSLPPVYRDMALVVAESVTHQNIVEAIQDIKPDFLSSVALFDVYTGDNLPAGKKSLAYSMVYEPEATSLTDEQVNTIHFKLVEQLKMRLGAELR